VDLVTFKSDALCVEWWTDLKLHLEFVGFFFHLMLVHVVKN
jgi:hypothetical protein